MTHRVWIPLVIATFGVVLVARADSPTPIKQRGSAGSGSRITAEEVRNCCKKLLEMQEAVCRETRSLESDLKEAEDDKTRAAIAQQSTDQSVTQNKIVGECTRALEMLEEEGLTFAFPESFRQLRRDMMNVEARLKSTDVGALTQSIEQDIIDELKQMILDSMKYSEHYSGPGRPPDSPQRPLDLRTELKRVRSMQIIVSNRTKMYHEAYPDEEQLKPENAKDPKAKAKLEQFQKELQELSNQEATIQRIVRDIIQSKNK